MGATNASSKDSELSITIKVCNKCPNATALDTVYNSLGEAMEKKRELVDLFDSVFTLPQAKPDPLTTSTATLIDTNVLNVQSGLLSQPPPKAKTATAKPPQLLQPNQVNTGPGLLKSATQV